MSSRLSASRPSQQRGIALFVVIIFVMLSMLLALWAARSSLFNELVVGNDADYQRAFEAAQALLQDAELDIRGEDANGGICTSDSCRDRQSSALKIPLEAQEVPLLLAKLTTETTLCLNALCAKRLGAQDFWSDESTLESMKGVGARYGQYTGAGKDTHSNPILAITDNKSQGGWYWIEILPYDDSSKNSGVLVNSTESGSISPNNILPLNLTPNIVYRITALAYGRKPSTTVLLQQTYARQKLKD